MKTRIVWNARIFDGNILKLYDGKKIRLFYINLQFHFDAQTSAIGAHFYTYLYFHDCKVIAENVFASFYKYTHELDYDGQNHAQRALIQEQFNLHGYELEKLYLVVDGWKTMRGIISIVYKDVKQ